MKSATLCAACVVLVLWTSGVTGNSILELVRQLDELEKRGIAGWGNSQPMRTLEEKIAKRLVTDGGAVAFHATVDGRLSSNHQAGETVVFETVKLNLGGGYDGTTGVFTCPTDGVYIFSTSIMTYHGTQTDVEKTRVHTAIMKNGEEIASAFASGGSGEMEQGSVSAAIELVRGDEVEVKFQRRNNMLMWGDKLTSFMGVLVTPL